MNPEEEGLDVTASGLERVRGCPASTSLPAILRNSDVAQRGTYIHTYLESILRGQPKALALTRVPEELRSTCRHLDYQRAVGDLTGRRPEVAFGINVYTRIARELVSVRGRRYPSPPPTGDVYGTTDVTGTRSWDGVPVIVDWKTGFDEVTPCRDNAQLKFAASAVALITGAPEVEARIAYVRPSGRVDVDRWTFSTLDIDEFLDELTIIYDGALVARDKLRKGVLPPLKPDDYCTYCPAFPACPAQVSLAKALVPALSEVSSTIAAMTPAEAGQAWRKLKDAERLVDTIKKALRAMARAEPLPTDATHEVRELLFPKRTFDAQRALELMREYGIPDEEIAACEPKIEISMVREMKRRTG